MAKEAHPPLAVEAIGLACNRGGRLVFADVSFRVDTGRLLAVVGANGAGKSSLLRLVAGLLRPAAGAIRFEGRDQDEGLVHYLGHADALKPVLTLRETLRLWTRLYRAHRASSDDEIDAAADVVGIAHALDLHAGVLSAGQRRRAGLARLILAPRPLWLLDEPTSALDSEGEALLGRLIAGHLAEGGLVLAATHQALPLTPHATLTLGAS